MTRPRTARSFTLLHELTHIYLGQTGVSGAPDLIKENTQLGRIEQFCNDVAGLILLPRNFAEQRPVSLGRDNKDAASRFIEDTAKSWCVSEPLVAFRLRRLGWISNELYRDLGSGFSRRWQTQKESAKAVSQLKEGGPNYYVLKQHRLGAALIEVVRRTLRENRLTHTKAAKLFGVKQSSVEPLIRRYEKSPASLRIQVTK